MKTVKGIYAEAKIFTDDVEDYAEAQVKMICDNEVAEGSVIRLMPDIHPGKVGPIGLSMTVTDKIIPQLLGVDIGCGMTCVKLKKANIEFQKLDKVIREKIPSGFPSGKSHTTWQRNFLTKGFTVWDISTGKGRTGALVHWEAEIILLNLIRERMAVCIL